MKSFTVGIEVGSVTGKFGWSGAQQSYVAELNVLGSHPAGRVCYGTRFGEYVTTDALVNYMMLHDLAISDESIELVLDLRAEVIASVGSAQIVGETDVNGKRTLSLLTQDGTCLSMSPAFKHPDYDFSWGNTSEKTVETAKSIYRHVWHGAPDSDAQSFALALTHEHLAKVEGSFALNVDSVCDWHLAGAELIGN